MLFCLPSQTYPKLASANIRVFFAKKNAMFMIVTNVYHILAKVFNNLLRLGIVIGHTVVRMAPFFN